jgi:Ca2+-binding EF-hand superfamily protein
MTSISGSSSASALQAQQLLQQLLKQAQASKQSDTTSQTASASSSPAASAFAAQLAPTTGAASSAATSSATPDLAQLFSSMDANGDGSVSKEEFSTAFQKLDPSSQSTVLSAQEQQTAVNDLFQQADTNGDGSISLSEMDNLAASVKPSGGGHHHHKHGAGSSTDGSTASVSGVFDSLDTNKDGVVSIDELAAAVGNDSASNTTTSTDIAGASSTVSDNSADPSTGVSVNQNLTNLLKLLSGQQASATQQQSPQLLSSVYA